MKYLRFHEKECAYATGMPRGIFVAVWKLLENGLVTDLEKNEYEERTAWFIENLPVPPFYDEGNPDKAITWYKNTLEVRELVAKMRFYFDMAKKYRLTLYKTETNIIPGEIIYEDQYQIAVVNSVHTGDLFSTITCSSD